MAGRKKKGGTCLAAHPSSSQIERNQTGSRRGSEVGARESTHQTEIPGGKRGEEKKDESSSAKGGNSPMTRQKNERMTRRVELSSCKAG